MFDKAEIWRQELSRVQNRIIKIERDLNSSAIVYNKSSYDYTKDKIKLRVLKELEVFIWNKL